MTNEVFTGGVGMKAKKDKEKVKKKPDDLESILASVEALAAKSRVTTKKAAPKKTRARRR
jgi:hypothetical protein